ncbi:glycerophosphodiester phosphodiesterase [Clostridium beijerinckii]|uniref:Putative glycerophosphoryl diester phosphodiesterase 1 n=1 Tax=Clostridium beijerinckii TaxID=1520 RepID=A0A1S8RWQ7_CLOBE|nr:glycerophosphodiester phosphodiesterase [Clostridium beijerinckii]NRY60500.1 glycerophosphoryl diester phosphodiesterase [Clostridium beijerinckii]OOM57614.1 putative glycerophosphoryl diester phosphodiesterase 1 [Clostridium beijerinckii]
MGTLNIAHRGYSGKFDENTILAFKKAIEYNADGIEADVQLSKDGIPVIIHDETLDRTTNGHGFVKDYTFDELRIFRTKSVPRVQALKDDALEERVRLEGENDRKFGESRIGEYSASEVEYLKNRCGEEIPALRELLELVANSDLKVLNLELKNSVIEYNGLEKKVLDMIDEFNLRDRIIISSLNHSSLLKVKELQGSNRIVLGALTETILVNVPKYLRSISVECYHPYFPSVLNQEYMKEIKESGIKINTYTVNSVADMKKVISAGVDGIITNEVEKLNTLLKKEAIL